MSTFYITWISKDNGFRSVILLLNGLYKLYEMDYSVIYSDVCYVNYDAIDPISDTIIFTPVSIKLVHRTGPKKSRTYFTSRLYCVSTQVKGRVGPKEMVDERKRSRKRKK
jgi:hypothetical protein